MAEDRIHCLYVVLSVSNLRDLAQESKLGSSVTAINPCAVLENILLNTEKVASVANGLVANK